MGICEGQAGPSLSRAGFRTRDQHRREGGRLLPVDKVGGSIHGVDDPGGFVREDAGLPVGHRLLPDEAAAKTREKFNVEKRRREYGPRGRVSPVRPLSEFLLQGPDDDLLHPLVGLGDQIHGRALGLDLNLALSGFSDLLNESRWEQNVQGSHFHPGTRILPTSPAILATSTAKSYAFCQGSSISFTDWELTGNKRRQTGSNKQKVSAPPPPRALAKERVA